jgi:hypothetical protein
MIYLATHRRAADQSQSSGIRATAASWTTCATRDGTGPARWTEMAARKMLRWRQSEATATATQSSQRPRLPQSRNGWRLMELGRTILTWQAHNRHSCTKIIQKWHKKGNVGNFNAKIIKRDFEIQLRRRTRVPNRGTRIPSFSKAEEYRQRIRSADSRCTQSNSRPVRMRKEGH